MSPRYEKKPSPRCRVRKRPTWAMTTVSVAVASGPRRTAADRWRPRRAVKGSWWRLPASLGLRLPPSECLPPGRQSWERFARLAGRPLAARSIVPSTSRAWRLTATGFQEVNVVRSKVCSGRGSRGPVLRTVARRAEWNVSCPGVVDAGQAAGLKRSATFDAVDDEPVVDVVTATITGAPERTRAPKRPRRSMVVNVPTCSPAQGLRGQVSASRGRSAPECHRANGADHQRPLSVADCADASARVPDQTLEAVQPGTTASLTILVYEPQSSSAVRRSIRLYLNHHRPQAAIAGVLRIHCPLTQVARVPSTTFVAARRTT